MEIATPVIAGMVLGIVCLNFAVAAAWFWVCKYRSKTEAPPSPSHSMNDANPVPSTSLQPFTQSPNMHQIVDNTVSRHSFSSIVDSDSHPPYKKPAATPADRKRLSARSASVTLDSSSLYSADSAREEGRDTAPHPCPSLRPNPRVPYATHRPSWAQQQSNGDSGRENMSSVHPIPSVAPRVKWTAPGRKDCAVATTETTPNSYMPNSPASTSEYWAYSPTSPIQPISPLRLERKPLFLSRNAAPPSINSSSQRLSLVSSSSEQPLLPGRHHKAEATRYEEKNET